MIARSPDAKPCLSQLSFDINAWDKPDTSEISRKDAPELALMRRKSNDQSIGRAIDVLSLTPGSWSPVPWMTETVFTFSFQMISSIMFSRR